MKNTIACLIFCCHFGAFAQSRIPEFGNVDPAELTMKTYAFEPGATAVNLIRTAKVAIDANDFTGDPTVTTAYRIRIKIFDKRGFSAANVKIPYASEEGASRIKDIEAYIYGLDADGKVTREKVERKEIFKDRSKAAIALNYVAFTFPDLSDGAIIEYKYTRVDKHTAEVHPWLFQDEFPTAYSNVVINTPSYAYMTYRMVSAGIVTMDSSVKKYANAIYNEDIRSFTMRNVHSFKTEPLMYSLSDNLERIEFSVTPKSFLHSSFLTNEQKLRYYSFSLLASPHFGYQFDRPLDGADGFIDSVKKLPSIEGRITAIYRYIVKNFEWNGEQTHYCDSVVRCWKTRSGSQAEINILFLNLLRKTGVACLPLLVSTHDNGNPDQDFPTMAQFNGVDIFVRDSSVSYIVDCTQKNLSFKTPPYNVLSSNAYIIDPDFRGWTFILDNRILMKDGITVNGTMDSTGRITGLTTATYTGFAKTAILDELKKKEDKPANDEEALANVVPGLTTDSTTLDNRGAGNDSLLEKVHFHYLPSSTDNIYFFDPSLFFALQKNPFKDTVRYSDVDFGCNQSLSTQLRIRLPENFSVESLPQGVALYKNDSTICFERKLSVENRYLVISNSLTIRNTIYIKEDYAALKVFFDKFYAFTNEQVVLKKH
jgi:Domain of Unknown Function with PDB structure (DUF3857)